jgi:putative phage-type endonuclease
MILKDMIQGSPEWHALRKIKITATDAPIIMGVSKWKTKRQLYNEKISQEDNSFVTERMQRGIDLEPLARDLFTLKTGIVVEPAIIVQDWTMASLDGLSSCGEHILEIKCPGETDHNIALNAKIPDHYYPQVQHQIYVSNLEFLNYFSFDGLDGVIVKVERDDKYIEKMIEEEKKFYDCIINRTPPESDENDYIERYDELWEIYASQYKSVNQKMKELELQEKELREELISLSGQSNSKGAGISLCQIQRKGNVDYSKIPELKNVDLEKYRKPHSSSWRINCQ